MQLTGYCSIKREFFQGDLCVEVLGCDANWKHLGLLEADYYTDKEIVKPLMFETWPDNGLCSSIE